MSRGQYSDAVLNELESQNDQQVEGILGKVKILKDVSFILLLLLRVSRGRLFCVCKGRRNEIEREEEKRIAKSYGCCGVVVKLQRKAAQAKGPLKRHMVDDDN